MNILVNQLIVFLPFLFSGDECEVFLTDSPEWVIGCFELDNSNVCFTLANGLCNKPLKLLLTDKINVSIRNM